MYDHSVLQSRYKIKWNLKTILFNEEVKNVEGRPFVIYVAAVWVG
jgi:hypothetical protein